MLNQLINYMNDISYEEFSENIGESLEKHFHSTDENNFSVFHQENEYMFIDGLLEIIEFNNLKFLEKEGLKIYDQVEENLEYFSSNSIKWEVFSKYSYKKYLVIKVMDYVFYEYKFHKNVFVLSLIRVSKRE